MNEFKAVLCLVAAFAGFAADAAAKDVVVKNDFLRITYFEQGKHFSVERKAGRKDYRPVILASVPEASYEAPGGRVRTVNTTMFVRMDYKRHAVEDRFGTGVRHEFIFTEPANGDDVSLRQDFYVYDGRDYVLTELTVAGSGVLCSNYLAPVSVNTAYDLYEAAETNRMLKVPFDNDGFVRYHKNRLDGEMTSYEVSAIYEGLGRNGIVVGSVEHDRWKSAVEVKASADGRVERLKVFSGVADKETRDELPHGKVKGPEVQSALMFIGAFDDWRDGMEEYAHANTLVQPMRDTWTRGTPFGWQSWGVMADKNNYDVDVAVSNYFKETLAPAGFHNSLGLNIMSIDAWDNMDSGQRSAFTRIVKANGQVPGTYVTPFAL